MIIKFTPEERERLQAIRKSYDPEREALLLKIRDCTDKDERAQLRIQQQALFDRMDLELQAFSEQCQRERFAQITGGAAGIIAHAKEQAPMILEALYNESSAYFTSFDAEILNKTSFASMKGGKFYLNANYAAKSLRDELKMHIDALKEDKKALQEVLAIIIETVKNSPYTDETEITPEAALKSDNVIFKPTMPMFHSLATDALAKVQNSDFQFIAASDMAIAQTKEEGYKFVIQQYSKIKGTYGINTHKLLCTAISQYTHTRTPRISIPLEPYARLLNYEIDERPTDSPEAAAKEKKRAAEVMKSARKRIRQDLELLHATRWTWQEKVKGKVGDFRSYVLFESVGIEHGYIIVEFGRNMAEILKRLPETQYHRGLYPIDARNENAYRIGLKLTQHYNMDSNIIIGTYNRLKVSTLLKHTNLPTIEKLKNEKYNNSRQWPTRIKEPFEKALDALTGYVITNWEYVKPKGEPLTDEEAYNITDYEGFIDLLVQFEIKDAPDHSDRLARRAEEKKAANAKPKKRRTKARK